MIKTHKKKQKNKTKYAKNTTLRSKNQQLDTPENKGN